MSQYRDNQHTNTAGHTNQKLGKPTAAQPSHTIGTKKIRFVTWERNTKERTCWHGETKTSPDCRNLSSFMIRQ